MHPSSTQPIIEVRNIGKSYKISHERGRYIALRDVLMTVLRKPFSFLKHKAKAAVGLARKEEFWALKGVDFTVNRGEVVGIIGHNGAGKSTLLKILSQITPPTEGEITVRGKIGSLLEVGTGFHPELSGRENIFLNGAILGMTKREIAAKFDQIVEFAGISKFLDTPVKYYSSGMYVRLAFSVAAHMEPDILLVDEVLAVGDVEFQKKCLGKMEEVTRTSGRTILFVSHNMAAVQSLCKRSVMLEGGRVVAMGDTREVIDRYMQSRGAESATTEFADDPHKPASITTIIVRDEREAARTEFPVSKPASITVEFNCHKKLPAATVSLLIYSSDRDLLLYSSQSDSTEKLASYDEGSYRVRINIPPFLLNVGHYSFDIIVHDPNVSMYAEARNMRFEVKNIANPRSLVLQNNHLGRISSILSYESERL